MSDLRKIFEKRDDISRHLKNDYIFWDGDKYKLNDKFNNKEIDLYSCHKVNLGWVLGMWEMFQELLK